MNNYSKYWAQKVEIDWIKFESKLEARFYEYLQREWWNILELQPKYLLQDKFIHNWKSIRKIEYIADFKIEKDWDIFILDAKWMQTPVFKMKYKMWLKKYWQDEILIVAKSFKDFEKQIDQY